jgi:Ribonuclease G/E
MTNLKKLDEAINELEKQSNELKDFNEIFSEINKLKKELKKSIELLEKSNQNINLISEKIEKNLKETYLKNDEIYRGNKTFQKELDSSLASRIEKVKSDLIVEIRNEGAKSQKNLESVMYNNFNQLKFDMKDATQNHSKQLNLLKIMMIGLLSLSIILYFLK